MIRAADMVIGQPWAITPDALRQIRDISLRLHDLEAGRKEVERLVVERENTPFAIAARQGAQIKGTMRARERQGVALLDVTGPIFPRASMMELSGATSLGTLSADLHAVLDNPDIKSVLINFDSPGGVAFGPGEMAELIYAATRKKPVTAYVSGMACSAAYWLAAACSEIVAHPSAWLGSVGIVTTAPVQELPDQDGVRFIEITSSNAANKRPDASTASGRARIVKEIDGLEKEFIGAVAKYRGVTRTDVIAAFDNGGVKIAKDAIAAGMADRTGNFEALLSEMASGRYAPQRAAAKKNPQPETKARTTMKPEEIKAEYPASAEALIKEGRDSGHKAGHAEGVEAGRKEGMAQGAKAERDRLAAIDGVAKAGHEQLIADAKADGQSTAADVALKIIHAEKAAGPAQLATVKDAAAKAPVIQPSVPAQAESAAAVQDDKDLPVEERAKRAYASDAKIRTEFPTVEIYTSFLKGSEAGALRSKKSA